MRRGWEKGSRGLFRLGQSLKFKTSAQGFDKEVVKDERWKYLDPGSLHRWNTFFVASCLVAVSVDPLFFFLPVVDYANECIEISQNLKVSVTVFRTTTDFIYMIHMFLRFRTAFTKPSTRVLGRGELVTDPYEIAVNYLRKDFWIDFVAVLPVPQVLILGPLCLSLSLSNIVCQETKLIFKVREAKRLMGLKVVTKRLIPWSQWRSCQSRKANLRE